MSRLTSERIADILEAIEKCNSYRSYLSDSKTAEMAMDANLRNLAIIGEAVNHLPAALYAKYPRIEWRAIVGLRNILVHQYFAVSTNEIIEILDQDLAALRTVLNSEQE